MPPVRLESTDLPMAILTLGISFRLAPIASLERLSFTDDDMAKAYRHAGDLEGLDEAVILSTCNRVEVYASVPSYHAGSLAVKRLLVETRGVSAEELADQLQARWEAAAVEHLFGVAAGLDSMVLGEMQIHAQVRDALRRAQDEGAAGPALAGLFQAAIHAGRRVRRETSLGAAPDAFVRLGADLAEETLGGLEDRNVAVVGAGQMAALAVTHLKSRGVRRVRVLNRSADRARALAERNAAEHGDLDELPHALSDVDLVVSATGSSGIVVNERDVLSAVQARRERPLVLVDLAMPRDIDPAAGSFATLYDIEALRARLVDHDEETAADVSRARTVVTDEVSRFDARRRADRLAPLITALRRRGDEALRTERRRYASRLADLSPDQHAAVEALGEGIVAKLLHDPITELKRRAEPGSSDAHARLLAELFGLDPPAE